LGLPHRVVTLEDPAALRAALADVDLVLNAAGPFLRTAAALAEACIDAGAHYVDIGNELQVFLSLYALHERAQEARVAVIPGVGFGVVATNCLARYVSEKVGGAERLASFAPASLKAPAATNTSAKTAVGLQTAMFLPFDVSYPSRRGASAAAAL
jgi:short subunit dehydrogenase-like uncharacterized protein